MSDMRGRHGRNFGGCYINLEGNDYALNEAVDDLCHISGCEIFARNDTKDGGVISMRVRAAQKTTIFEIARKRGLRVR